MNEFKKEIEEQRRILVLQRELEQGKIKEKELSEYEIKKLKKLYKNQISSIETDIEMYKKTLIYYKKKIIALRKKISIDSSS